MRAPSELGYEARWVNVAPLLEREQLVADTHTCIRFAGRNKLLEALQQHHRWPGMYLDAAKCVRTSAASQREHVGPKTREDLSWIDKGDVLLWGLGHRYRWGLPQGPRGQCISVCVRQSLLKVGQSVSIPIQDLWQAVQAFY